MNTDQLQLMHTMLTNALSNENDIRQHAEREIQNHVTQHRDIFLVGLLTLLRSSKDEKVRSLCTILLSNNVTRGEPVPYDELPQQLQQHLKAELLLALASESVRYVRARIADTVVQLAECVIFKDQWPELFPFLYKLASAPDEPLRISAITIIGHLAINCGDVLSRPIHIVPIRQLLGNAMNDPSLHVKAQAVIAALQCVLTIEEQDEKSNKITKSFQELLPQMLNILGAVLSAHEEDVAKEILEVMVEICGSEEEAGFLRPILEPLSQAWLTIGTTTNLDDGIRQYCMVCFTLLAESKPALIRKHPNIIRRACQLAFALMMEVEEDDDWCRKPETNLVYDDSNVDCGEESLDRLGMAIGGAKLKSIVCPMISEVLRRTDDWRYRNVGLKAMCQIGDTLPLDEIPLKQLVQFTKDPHPRVRYAAIDCLGQLALDFSPTFAHQFHSILYPVLMEPLKDTSYPRNQCHAAAALFNLIDSRTDEEEDDTEPHIVDLYCDQLLQTLLQLLEKGPQMVQEQVMTAIAAIAANASKEKFLPYYTLIAKVMKHIIVHARDKNARAMRARAMESISHIGLSMGKDVFREDAKEIMGMFLEIMKSNQMAPDDESHQFMLQAWTRICTVLKEEFVPVLHHVIPIIYEQASKVTQYKTITDPDDDDQDDDEFPINNTGKGLTVTTRGDENAINACSMLCSFCHDLLDHFFIYVPKTAEIMIPLLAFESNEDVKHLAITVMPDLIKASLGAYKAGKTDATYVKGLFTKIMSSMLERFKIEQDVDLLQALVTAIQEMATDCGPVAVECIDTAGLNAIWQALLFLLNKSHARIKAREEFRETDDYDEEEEIKLEAMNHSEDQLNYMVSECLSVFMKTHQTAFLPVFDQIFPELLRMLHPDSIEATRKVAFYIWDDMMAYIGAPAAHYLPHIMPHLIRDVNAEEPSIRQPAAYGIAWSAQSGGNFFKPFVNDAITALLRGITAPGSRDPINASPTDNMIAALAKIAQYQEQPQLYPQILDYLPLLSDWGEGAYVYGLICTLVESNNSTLLGSNFKHLPRIIDLLLSYMSMDESDETVNQRIHAILKQTQKMPANALQQLISVLTPDNQLKLQQVFSSS